MPWGYWVQGKQETPYGTQPAAYWVDDPNGPQWRDPFPVQAAKWGVGCYVACIILLVIILGVPIGIFAFKSLVVHYIPAPNDFVENSQWQGNEWQYENGPNEETMSLVVDSIAGGNFTGRVSWYSTTTNAYGTIVTKLTDKQWQYVLHPKTQYAQFTTCSKGAIYLQFTETSYAQGNNAVLNLQYYAIACGGNISGFWFWPNKPKDGPGGEFTLSLQQ